MEQSLSRRSPPRELHSDKLSGLPEPEETLDQGSRWRESHQEASIVGVDDAGCLLPDRGERPGGRLETKGGFEIRPRQLPDSGLPFDAQRRRVRLAQHRLNLTGVKGEGLTHWIVSTRVSGQDLLILIHQVLR